MIFAIPLAVAGCERDLVDALVRVVAHQRVVRVRLAVLDVDVLVLVEKAHLVADLVGVLDLGVDALSDQGSYRSTSHRSILIM